MEDNHILSKKLANYRVKMPITSPEIKLRNYQQPGVALKNALPSTKKTRGKGRKRKENVTI